MMNRRVTVSDDEQVLISQFRLLSVEAQKMILDTVCGLVAKTPWAPKEVKQKGGE